MIVVPCTKGEQEDIEKNITQLIKLTKYHGFDDTGFDPAPTIDWWVQLIGYIPIERIFDADGTEYKKSRVITLTKYKVAAFVAFWSNTSLPQTVLSTEFGDLPDDKTNIIIGGRYNVFVQKFILRKPSGDEGRLSFLQTIIQSKSLMVRPDKEFVRYAEIKTFEKLTGTKVHGEKKLQDGSKGQLEDNEKMELDREFIRGKINRTIQTIFTHQYTDQHRLAYTLPSASSNYNFTRKMYGAIGHLLPHATRLNATPDKSLVSFKTKGSNREAELEEQIEDEEMTQYTVDVSRLTKRVYDFRKSVFAEAMETIPYAVPLGLSEPSKVRVITKGPPSIYFILKPLQKFMHNIMRKLKQFQLLGQEVTSEMINQMFTKVNNDQAMLSGDYTDATNELKMWVSEMVTDAVIDKLNLTDKEAVLIRRSLTEHVIKLQEMGGKGFVAEAKQTDGQLMGSILSFIWLSLVNLTLVWVAKELELEEEIQLEDLQCLINGDDCLFAVNNNGKYMWKRWGAVMGLNPSVGKVFYTNEFCTLNSRMFRNDLGEWKDVPFISSSLLSGTEKSVRLGTEHTIDPLIKINDIGVRNYWLMIACPITARYKVQQEFIKNNSPLLKHPLLEGIDWFMPFWSGGLGMCDVNERGWVLNISNFKGNPAVQLDDNMEPEGSYKDYKDEQNKSRIKSRCAQMHMLYNWGQIKFRPKSWTQVKLPENLNMLQNIAKKLPQKPTESWITEKSENPVDNINDKLTGLMAMDLYLTDTETQAKISNDIKKVINMNRNSYWLEKKKIFKLNDDKSDWIEIADVSDMGKKKKRKLFEELLSEDYMDEHVKRIKYNKSIWRNNIKGGCSKPADYDKLTNRKYINIFKGEIIGKGARELNLQNEIVPFYYTMEEDKDFPFQNMEQINSWD